MSQETAIKSMDNVNGVHVMTIYKQSAGSFFSLLTYPCNIQAMLIG
ncbi:MAG: hypothetical protein ACP5F6_02820 [Microbacter sp.]